MSNSAPLPRYERSETGLGLASWYTAGRSDGFGDRLLMFDNTGAASLELLRFRPDLAIEPGFEDLLRQRVQRLAAFQHPAFAAIRAVEHLEGGEGLALVSNHTAGKRLSELLDARRPPAGIHPAFVSWLVQQLTPLLAALQTHGYDIVHGALTIERIVLASDGRVMIVEHALGSAIRGLELTPARLWREFAIIARPTSRGEACLDARGDIMQLGVIALSLLLGRRMTLEDVQTDLPKLLDEFAALPHSRTSVFTEPLRRWLERALQLHPQAYRSAAEALDGLKELPEQSASTLPALLNSLMPGLVSETPAPVEPPALAWSAGAAAEETEEETVTTEVDEAEDTPPVAAPPPIAAQPVVAPLSSFTSERRAAEPTPVVRLAEPTPVVRLAPVLPPPSDLDVVEERSLDISGSNRPAVLAWSTPPDRPTVGHGSLMRLVTPVLALIAIAEAAIIAALIATRPATPATPTSPSVAVTVEAPRAGTEVFVNGRAAGRTPLKLTLDGNPTSIRIDGGQAPAAAVIPASPSVAPAGNDATAAALAQAAARQRSGGVRFTSSIPLQVLEGNRVLGTTSEGPVVATAGTHVLDLVNTELGFRTRQSVTVRAGEIVTFTVVTPMGRLSVNAQPWAQVWVDQTAVGETPIANLAVSLGQHEVTFRHPTLGERKEIVIVRADGVTRLSTTLMR